MASRGSRIEKHFVFNPTTAGTSKSSLSPLSAAPFERTGFYHGLLAQGQDVDGAQPLFVFSNQCVPHSSTVLDYEFYFTLRTTRTTSVFLFRFAKFLTTLLGFRLAGAVSKSRGGW
jgi:hypothetical protein